jgi:predicted amidohydrolase YtcJ
VTLNAGRSSLSRCLLAGALLVAAHRATATPSTPADFVLTDGKIYTADARHAMATALAVRGGHVVAVGSYADVHPWIGPATHVQSAEGRVVLPGLVDAHIHPIDIVDPEACILEARPLSLADLAAYVRSCVNKYAPVPGEWLKIYEWNYSDGNQPDEKFQTLRAALDGGSATVAIALLGSDGHHGAYNSAALAMARDEQDNAVGLTKATLAREFAAYRAYVGVDATGEPNGAVNETAQNLLNPAGRHYDNLDAALRHPEAITARLSSAGITAIMDASASPEGLPVYDTLRERGILTARVTLAQYFDPDEFRKPDHSVDFAQILRQARLIRARYARDPLIRADFVKVFADGGIEGNPLADPPTLPNAAVLRPYLQPIFRLDLRGQPTVIGYVDTISNLCRAVRAHPENYQSVAAVAAFRKRHHYHPAQCEISRGQLRYPRALLMQLIRRYHLDGFNIHVHTIGDRAIRTTLDAIEAARAADGNEQTHDSLAHVLLANPADVARMGRDHLFLAFTYWWATPDPEDMSVIPFLQRVSGNSYRALHRPGSYYEENVYPVRRSLRAGATLVAGSDAPVVSRNPMPFFNIMGALVRHERGRPALNPRQTISLRDALDAYTINGARMLGREQEFGSLIPSKSADFIIIDQDIFKLVAQSHAETVGDIQVLETWFQGRRVYAAATSANATP